MESMGGLLEHQTVIVAGMTSGNLRGCTSIYNRTLSCRDHALDALLEPLNICLRDGKA